MKDIFNRNCPTCNREILYKGYEGHRVASKSNTSCKSCIALKRTKEHYEKIGKAVSAYRKGKTYEEIYGEELAAKLKQSHSEKLTGRSREIFSQEWRDNLSKSHKQSKAFKDAMNCEEYRDKRRQINVARFYPTLEKGEWEALQTGKRLYYLKVFAITRQQPTHLLENFSKRGQSGKGGAYQLDHIYPISLGFINKIPAEEIGNISNLKMIPWLENVLKSNKL